ncbi:HRDC domain-containing protein [Branchiibius cervicis]|uniref:HRDC domain-containing protein n=1 Tax=Branchiibius cervicis TaxID=908252 RepID=A0ABW2AS36_9MICO
MESADSENYPVLEAPRDGLPPVTATERDLLVAADAIAAGSGPIAIDAERASGYRYGNRAYLVQLRRNGAGTFLFDPAAIPDLSPVQDAIGGAEWILHAATQDLVCLAEVGLRPASLFDTEVGARLAGLPRVGLAAVIEHYLGVSLAKEHSAVDWSTRPLPEPWLRYAALDVELLVDVRDAMYADLQSQGKLDWALQDFAALTRFAGPPVREEPWRRTSGLHTVRDRRVTGRVRELWQTRDRIAQDRDTSPGRVLPDAVLIEMAKQDPKNAADLAAIRTEATSRRGKARPAHTGVPRYQRDWLDAVRRADALPAADLPGPPPRTDAPPPARSWSDRDPAAAARLASAREQLAVISDERNVPVENILQPDTLRRILWQLPDPLDDNTIRGFLTQRGARPWQVELTLPVIKQAATAQPAEDTVTDE